jgi:hypothetical protein
MPIIINLTEVDAHWKEVCYNTVKRNWTITYFTSVLFVIIQRPVNHSHLSSVNNLLLIGRMELA